MVRCPRCHAEFEVPRSLSAEQRAEVVARANDVTESAKCRSLAINW